MDGYLFDVGDPLRRAATQSEIADVVKPVVNLAIIRRHRGRPPLQMGWEDFKQEVTLGTVRRLARFKHGGKFPLQNYAYFAACCALADLQRKNMRCSAEATTESLPLIDYLERIA